MVLEKNTTYTRSDTYAKSTIYIPIRRLGLHLYFYFIYNKHIHIYIYIYLRRSQWTRGRRRRCTAARLLRLRVRIPPGGMDVCRFECCVLSGRGLCDGPITRPGESYWLWCVVCSRNLKNEDAMASVGPQRHRKNYSYLHLQIHLPGSPVVCSFYTFTDTRLPNNTVPI